MGNYRFKLSDMIPNAWFYKLRDMNKIKTTTNHHHHKKPPSTTTPPPQTHHFSQPRNSFYYTPKISQFHNINSPKFPHFHHDPPRKSSKRSKPNRKTIYKPSQKHTSLTESTHTLQESPSSESTHSELATCTCSRLTSSKSPGFSLSPEIEVKLPPIITKPAKPSLSGKKLKENNQTPARKSFTGVKLKPNSPKLAVSKRIVQKSSQKKNNLPESFAIVKSSFDPHKDFSESMMEMIVENNIKRSQDLEELLACYLSLNSDEYHDVIVDAFEQIWFNLHDL